MNINKKFKWITISGPGTEHKYAYESSNSSTSSSKSSIVSNSDMDDGSGSSLGSSSATYCSCEHINWDYWLPQKCSKSTEHVLTIQDKNGNIIHELTFTDNDYYEAFFDIVQTCRRKQFSEPSPPVIHYNANRKQLPSNVPSNATTIERKVSGVLNQLVAKFDYLLSMGQSVESCYSEIAERLHQMLPSPKQLVRNLLAECAVQCNLCNLNIIGKKDPPISAETSVQCAVEQKNSSSQCVKAKHREMGAQATVQTPKQERAAQCFIKQRNSSSQCEVEWPLKKTDDECSVKSRSSQTSNSWYTPLQQRSEQEVGLSSATNLPQFVNHKTSQTSNSRFVPIRSSSERVTSVSQSKKVSNYCSPKSSEELQPISEQGKKVRPPKRGNTESSDNLISQNAPQKASSQQSKKSRAPKKGQGCLENKTSETSISKNDPVQPQEFDLNPWAMKCFKEPKNKRVELLAKVKKLAERAANVEAEAVAAIKEEAGSITPAAVNRVDSRRSKNLTKPKIPITTSQTTFIISNHKRETEDIEESEQIVTSTSKITICIAKEKPETKEQIPIKATPTTTIISKPRQESENKKEIDHVEAIAPSNITLSKAKKISETTEPPIQLKANFPPNVIISKPLQNPKTDVNIPAALILPKAKTEATVPPVFILAKHQKKNETTDNFGDRNLPDVMLSINRQRTFLLDQIRGNSTPPDCILSKPKEQLCQQKATASPTTMQSSLKAKTKQCGQKTQSGVDVTPVFILSESQNKTLAKHLPDQSKASLPPGFILSGPRPKVEFPEHAKPSIPPLLILPKHLHKFEASEQAGQAFISHPTVMISKTEPNTESKEVLGQAWPRELKSLPKHLKDSKLSSTSGTKIKIITENWEQNLIDELPEQSPRKNCYSATWPPNAVRSQTVEKARRKRLRKKMKRSKLQAVKSPMSIPQSGSSKSESPDTAANHPVKDPSSSKEVPKISLLEFEEKELETRAASSYHSTTLLEDLEGAGSDEDLGEGPEKSRNLGAAYMSVFSRLQEEIKKFAAEQTLLKAQKLALGFLLQSSEPLVSKCSILDPPLDTEDTSSTLVPPTFTVSKKSSGTIKERRDTVSSTTSASVDQRSSATFVCESSMSLQDFRSRGADITSSYADSLLNNADSTVWESAVDDYEAFPLRTSLSDISLEDYIPQEPPIDIPEYPVSFHGTRLEKPTQLDTISEHSQEELTQLEESSVMDQCYKENVVEASRELSVEVNVKVCNMGNDTGNKIECSNLLQESSLIQNQTQDSESVAQEFEKNVNENIVLSDSAYHSSWVDESQGQGLDNAQYPGTESPNYSQNSIPSTGLNAEENERLRRHLEEQVKWYEQILSSAAQFQAELHKRELNAFWNSEPELDLTKCFKDFESQDSVQLKTIRSASNHNNGELESHVDPASPEREQEFEGKPLNKSKSFYSIPEGCERYNHSNADVIGDHEEMQKGISVSDTGLQIGDQEKQNSHSSGSYVENEDKNILDHDFEAQKKNSHSSNSDSKNTFQREPYEIETKQDGRQDLAKNSSYSGFVGQTELGDFLNKEMLENKIIEGRQDYIERPVYSGYSAQTEFANHLNADTGYNGQNAFETKSEVMRGPTESSLHHGYSSQTLVKNLMNTDKGHNALEEFNNKPEIMKDPTVCSRNPGYLTETYSGNTSTKNLDRNDLNEYVNEPEIIETYPLHPGYAQTDLKEFINKPEMMGIPTKNSVHVVLSSQTNFGNLSKNIGHNNVNELVNKPVIIEGQRTYPVFSGYSSQTEIGNTPNNIGLNGPNQFVNKPVIMGVPTAYPVYPEYSAQTEFGNPSVTVKPEFIQGPTAYPFRPEYSAQNEFGNPSKKDIGNNDLNAFENMEGATAYLIHSGYTARTVFQNLSNNEQQKSNEFISEGMHSPTDYTGFSAQKEFVQPLHGHALESVKFERSPSFKMCQNENLRRMSACSTDQSHESEIATHGISKLRSNSLPTAPTQSLVRQNLNTAKSEPDQVHEEKRLHKDFPKFMGSVPIGDYIRQRVLKLFEERNIKIVQQNKGSGHSKTGMPPKKAAAECKLTVREPEGLMSVFKEQSDTPCLSCARLHPSQQEIVSKAADAQEKLLRDEFRKRRTRKPPTTFIVVKRDDCSPVSKIIAERPLVDEIMEHVRVNIKKRIQIISVPALDSSAEDLPTRLARSSKTMRPQRTINEYSGDDEDSITCISLTNFDFSRSSPVKPKLS